MKQIRPLTATKSVRLEVGDLAKIEGICKVLEGQPYPHRWIVCCIQKTLENKRLTAAVSRRAIQWKRKAS